MALALAWGMGARAEEQPADGLPAVELAAGRPLEASLAQHLSRAALQFQRLHGSQAAAIATARYLAGGDAALAVVAAALDADATLRLAACQIDGTGSLSDGAALRLLGVALARPVVVNAQGEVQLTLGPVMLPAASNGRGRVAYWRQVGARRELRLAEPGLIASRLALVSDEPPSATFPGRPMEWSPAGDALAFRGIRNGRPHLYVVNASGTDLRCLTPPREAECDPCWSPDGAWVASVPVSDGATQGWLTRPDGSERHPLTLVPPMGEYPDETPRLIWDLPSNRPRYRSIAGTLLAIGR
ncbi:MAG: hypothetical protein HY320_14845 [Armatimonadetes bacterium]|nr:hypothetical protein [Armatimonadota bacterium]